MSKIAVILGSKNDIKKVNLLFETFDQFGIEYVTKILSAHRTPKELVDFVSTAEQDDITMFIAIAGGAAHFSDSHEPRRQHQGSYWCGCTVRIRDSQWIDGGEPGPGARNTGIRNPPTRPCDR